jgi:hypothetical protein
MARAARIEILLARALQFSLRDGHAGRARARNIHHDTPGCRSPSTSYSDVVIPDAAPAPASQARSDRLWIWAALALQFLGYVIDVVWHGLVHPGAEPTTVREMARHLLTVHAPLYLGAACVLLAVLRAVVHRARHPAMSATPHAATVGPLAVALTGALLSAGSEAWHAYAHLHLNTHDAPIAGVLSVVGYLVAVGATIVGGRRARRRGSDSLTQQRAA